MTFNNHARRPEAVSGQKQEGFITIARVTRTQGRKGEVAASLFTDFPERFAERKRLFLMNPLNNVRTESHLEEHWFHKGQVVLKFDGVDSISDAEKLVGCEVQIPLAERAALEEGSFYVSDLTGCRVFDNDREIGRIEDVRFGSGEAPLLVVQGAKEYLVPFAAAYIEELDVTQKRLLMKLPEGMLELDAPLNEEEKQRQKKQD
jgi:16S rRNA processing protein RimM